MVKLLFVTRLPVKERRHATASSRTFMLGIRPEEDWWRIWQAFGRLAKLTLYDNLVSGKGKQKCTFIHILWIRGRGGPPMWISKRGGPPMWIIFLSYNIIIKC